MPETESGRTDYAVVATVGWLYAMWVVLRVKLFSGEALSLAELGDFIGGAVAAPLAFMWLVVGYFQQGRELRQNRDALLLQERALQVQIEEMRRSLVELSRHTELLEDERKRATHAIQPRFGFAELIYGASDVSGSLVNHGERAEELRLVQASPCEVVLPGRVSVARDEHVRFRVPALGAEAKFTLEFRDTMRRRYLQDLVLNRNTGNLAEEPRPHSHDLQPRSG